MLYICVVVGFRENFDVDNVQQEPQARMLLDQMMRLLQEVALQNQNVVERVKLQHISRNLVRTANSPDVYNWSKATVWLDVKHF